MWLYYENLVHSMKFVSTEKFTGGFKLPCWGVNPRPLPPKVCIPMEVISNTSHAMNEACNYEKSPYCVFLVYAALNGKKPVWPSVTL